MLIFEHRTPFLIDTKLVFILDNTSLNMAKENDTLHAVDTVEMGGYTDDVSHPLFIMHSKQAKYPLTLIEI